LVVHAIRAQRPKRIASGSGGPFTTYKEEIRRHVGTIRAHGGNIVVISPMERRGFDEHGEVRPSLADYAQASREVSRELGVPFIDLNRLSRNLHRALGLEGSAVAFATVGGKIDNTHRRQSLGATSWLNAWRRKFGA
jgi:hypothetical protein